jgi:molybdopterin synthase sulfur carrier subunit
MRLLYFAWVRERVGKTEETLDLPANVKTVGDLMAYLAKRDAGHAAAFANAKFIRAALDRTHVKHDAPIATAREIAFFPPMTGG